MQALLVTGPGRYGLTELPEPEPGPGEVLIAPTCVGICGSDVELLSGLRPDGYVRYPVVPGHEWVAHRVEQRRPIVGVERGRLYPY